MKPLFIVVLLSFLIYLISKRLTHNSSTTNRPDQRFRHYTRLDHSAALLNKATKSTIRTVGIGFLLLLSIIVLGIKIKILWIALPLALYLIGQLFVYLDQLKYLKDQQIYYNKENAAVWVDYINKPALSFNMQQDLLKVSEIRAIQKNGDILFGYYKLQLKTGEIIIISTMLAQSEELNTQQFFQALQQAFNIPVEPRLFPIA